MTRTFGTMASVSPKIRFLLGCLLVLITLIAYLPALQADYVWDDRAMTQNPLLADANGLVRIWLSPADNPDEQHYWPLVYTVFWVQRLWWGVHPFGYHLVNIALHALNCLLLWTLLSRLRLKAAWPAAAIFAVHPVHVESVAWVIELKDLLSALFYLLSILAFVSSCNGPARRVPYAVSLLLFVCAMLSKSIVVTLPVSLLLITWWQKGSVSRRDIRAILPFALIAVVISAFDLWLVSRSSVGSPSFTLMERVFIAGRAWWFYLAKLFFPVGLTAVYPKWDIDSLNVSAFLFPLAAVTAVVLLYMARRLIGRGPFTAVTFHVVTLFPVLGFVSFAYMQHSYVADRFQYIASIGPIALAASLLDSVATRSRWRLTTAYGLLLAPLLIVFSGMTFAYSMAYRDSASLFRQTIQRNPRAWSAHLGWGVELASQGRNAEALVEFETAKQLNPENSMVRYNLAHLLMRTGNQDAAEDQLREALRITPDLARAHVGLGVICAQRGRLEEAAAHFRKALEIDPRNAVARRNLDAVTSSPLSGPR